MAGTEKRTITESDRLRLVGLLTLAEQVNREHDRIARAVAELTGSPDEGDGYFGLASDTVSEVGRIGGAAALADDLLGTLGIEVVPGV